MDARNSADDPLARLVLSAGSETQIRLVRSFRAPRRLVFDAFSRPEHLRQWWGPRGHEMVACELDFRAGGAWRCVQRGPGGSEYGFHGVYREIVPGERLVYTFEFDGAPGHVSVETVEFTEREGVTTLVNTVVFESRADRDAMLGAGMETGARQTMDRLDEFLDTLAAPANEIVLARIFEAPRDLVWKAWTDPAHVARWWGPNGFSTTIEVMDVRPGGRWKHVMHGPDGTDYPNKSTFTEVVPPERISYSHGGGRKGGPGVRFEATWTFAALSSSRTRVAIRMIFDTADARDTVVREYGAIEGGRQTLARLADYLGELSKVREPRIP